jgi:uncharacterized protein
MLPNEVFLDTAFAIALSVASDEHHQKALLLADELEAHNVRLVTTHAVLLEIGNALSKARYRQAAISLLEALESDPNVQTVVISETIYAQAFLLYRNRMDKEWGLTDCISFVVMDEYKLTAALTTDEHFQQAGFQALLR